MDSSRYRNKICSRNYFIFSWILFELNKPKKTPSFLSGTLFIFWYNLNKVLIIFLHFFSNFQIISSNFSSRLNVGNFYGMVKSLMIRNEISRSVEKIEKCSKGVRVSMSEIWKILFGRGWILKKRLNNFFPNNLILQYWKWKQKILLIALIMEEFPKVLYQSIGKFNI